MAQSQDTTKHCEAKRPSKKCSQVGKVDQVASELQGLGSKCKPISAFVHHTLQNYTSFPLPSTQLAQTINTQKIKHGSNAQIRCLPVTCPWHRQARRWNSDHLRRLVEQLHPRTLSHRHSKSSAAGQVESILGANDPIRHTKPKICESHRNHRVLAPHAGPARASAVHLELEARVRA